MSCRRLWKSPPRPCDTPNPSKAPWYFLGLQEMLVYYDPWMAGVVFPSLIIVGLMAIPYIDFNKRGNGYYSFKERAFAVLVFMFGFLPLWIAMIILGTFLRGPNWNIFGIYEFWDVHKVEVLNNVNLSEMFWLNWLHLSLPVAPAGCRHTPSDRIHLLPGMAGVCGGLGLLLPLATRYVAGALLLEVLQSDGFHPLHGVRQPDAVDGGVADQDGPPVGLQPEVHRRHSGMVF